MLRAERKTPAQVAGAKSSGASKLVGVAPGAVGGVEKKKTAQPRAPQQPACYLSNIPKDLPASTITDALVQETGIEPKSLEVLKAGLPGRARSCGLATAVFRTQAEADEVAKKMDGKLLLGRPIICRCDKFAEDAPAAGVKAAAAGSGGVKAAAGGVQTRSRVAEAQARA